MYVPGCIVDSRVPRARTERTRRRARACGSRLRSAPRPVGCRQLRLAGGRARRLRQRRRDRRFLAPDQARNLRAGRAPRRTDAICDRRIAGAWRRDRRPRRLVVRGRRRVAELQRPAGGGVVRPARGRAAARAAARPRGSAPGACSPRPHSGLGGDHGHRRRRRRTCSHRSGCSARPGIRATCLRSRAPSLPTWRRCGCSSPRTERSRSSRRRLPGAAWHAIERAGRRHRMCCVGQEAITRYELLQGRRAAI